MEIFTTIQDDNLGGLVDLYFAPTYFFSNDNPIAFKAGKDWIHVQAILETYNFDEQTAVDEHGDYQVITISCSVARIRPEIHALLQKYRGQRMLVKTLDMNDCTRLAGTLEPDGGLMLTDQSTTGGAITDRNGYKIQLTGKQLQTSKFL